MAESGGPTTQAGIYYQNTIAALYLGRMLDLRERPTGDRVTSVRVEAPEHVDDIVVTLGDGSQRFIQAKSAIQVGTPAWVGVWQSFSEEFGSPHFGPEDRLRLVLGSQSALAENLRQCCERTTSSASYDEYVSRLTSPQRDIFNSIVELLTAHCQNAAELCRRIFSRTDVEVIPQDTVERDYAPLWMPLTSVSPESLVGTLRDLVGGGSRYRERFHAPTLRARLGELGLSIEEPKDWGGGIYRDIVKGRAVIEIPGTDIAVPIDEKFVWPRATRYESRRSDFEDDIALFPRSQHTDDVDVSQFPVDGFNRAVVVAGPGFGKSVLTKALGARIAAAGQLPVIVSIPALSKLDKTIANFLTEEVNAEHGVRIDWLRAAESGLLVLLLDGLDEISAARRTVVLERLKTFSLRYPSTSWLVTVRDAAALSSLSEATVVELVALDDGDDVVRQVRFYKPDAKGLAARITRQMAARPDFRRLTRIPLFLALLLATLKNPDELPTRRTELLETYLSLLFNPEQFKIGEFDSLDPNDVRTIAEAVAFDALERDEIGVGLRSLQLTIRRTSTSIDVQMMIERLVKCGVLRRSGQQYLFPFPIVQEYLASCFMLLNREGDIPARLISAVKRPWAQTLQFVLEQHPSPSGLISSLLSSPDDVFHTNLRLVARCASNGMKVDPSTWTEIVSRLAGAWPHTTWRMRGQIGDLIADAFSRPLIAPVKQLLHNRNLLYLGAGKIVARAHDKQLTRDVLTHLLAGGIEDLWHLHELQAAINELGDDALNIYMSYLPLTEDEGAEQPTENYGITKALARLISYLDGAKISEDARLKIVMNEELPHQIRISAACLGPSPLEAWAAAYIQSIVNAPEWCTDALTAIFKMNDSSERLRHLLSRNDLGPNQRLNIINTIVNVVDKDRLPQFLLEICCDPSIDEELKLIAKVFAARYGDESAMRQLIDGFSSSPASIVHGALSIFGFHRSDALVQRAVSLLVTRALAPEDRVFLASGCVLGMTSRFEMGSLGSGPVVPAPSHPGIAHLRRLVASWDERADYSPCERVKLGESLFLLGVEEAEVGLGCRIARLLETLDSSSENWEECNAIGQALRTLSERQQLLDLHLLESIVARCSFNGASAALSMIAAIGTRDVVDLLVSLHGTLNEYHLVDEIVDLLEPLAGRFSLKIELVNGQLSAKPLADTLVEA
ncbi:NACHT domain-containing protein [Burkholderia cepacia]|uniref:NACHT domain-containing protein n=1 Tax=Burkholderia cepacia TaxID=292 RepID=UPI000A4500BD|nr:hypothetical protein [Burkholderia cepacia]